MKDLTKAEELILLTIYRLRNNTYGVELKRKIQEITGKDFAYGTLYFLLDQLSAKEYVLRVKGEPTKERGGRSKTYYNLTAEGITALKESKEMFQKAWDGLDELSIERGPIE